MVPIGLFFGRIGNFVHGELYGRVTDVPWAMIYPKLGIAIITTGLVTLQWRSSWPDLIVGLGIALMNADAAKAIWTAARDEHASTDM